MTFKIESLTSQTLDTYQGQVRSLYAQFETEAMTRYGWELPPARWQDTLPLLTQAHLQGTLAFTPTGEPAALLLYRHEAHRVIEINMLICPPAYEGNRELLDALMQHLLPELLTLPDWDVLSFAMLGCQGRWIHTIGWYGFHPVGQAIVALDFMDLISVQVFAKQTLAPLPEGFLLVPWHQLDPSIPLQSIAQVIFKAFSPTNDVLWDPRFNSQEGCEQLLQLIVHHHIGQHLDDCSHVLLKEGEPVGLCFLLQTGPMLANIPLIGLIPGLQGQGLGKWLLSATVRAAIKRMMDETLLLQEITATTDTERFSALQMYRRFGFQERASYPHAYLPRTELENKNGQWVWC